jgi:hypothetical protein
MRGFLCILLIVPPVASAEIFSCRGEHGVTVYQNFACEFTSLGSVPASGAAAAKPAPPASTGAIAATKARSPTTSPARAPAAIQATSAPGEPRPGMSDDDVRNAWGDPDEITQDEPPSGRVEIWNYKGGRSVQINRKHRVVAVQR